MRLLQNTTKLKISVLCCCLTLTVPYVSEFPHLHCKQQRWARFGSKTTRTDPIFGKQLHHVLHFNLAEILLIDFLY
jgi:hypothetical protein